MSGGQRVEKKLGRCAETKSRRDVRQAISAPFLKIPPHFFTNNAENDNFHSMRHHHLGEQKRTFSG
jgi:hypothetical protein